MRRRAPTRTLTPLESQNRTSDRSSTRSRRPSATTSCTCWRTPEEVTRSSSPRTSNTAHPSRSSVITLNATGSRLSLAFLVQDRVPGPLVGGDPFPAIAWSHPNNTLPAMFTFGEETKSFGSSLPQRGVRRSTRPLHSREIVTVGPPDRRDTDERDADGRDADGHGIGNRQTRLRKRGADGRRFGNRQE
jgi:hypothetical protein